MIERTHSAWHALLSVFPAIAIERIGWMLVHSLWQFALVGILAKVVLVAMRRSSAAARYSALVGLLAVMAVVPGLTWQFTTVEQSSAPAMQFEPRKPDVQPASDASVPRVENVAFPGIGSTSEVPAASRTAVPSLDANVPTPAGPAESQPWQSWFIGLLRPWLSTIVIVWGAGVVAFAMRPTLSWFTVRRLRTNGVSPVTAEVADTLTRLAQALGVRRFVRVVHSTCIHVPIVVGYLRPLVLLPICMASGVPLDQLEAVLAHELAHVRRHDFLVNGFQLFVETMFFYHPAAWWLSRQIRIERENCCDDLAVAVVGNRLTYGRALLAIEEMRGGCTALALAVNDGSLLARVRRLIGKEPIPGRTGGAMAFAGLATIALLAVAIFVAVGRAQSKDTEKTHRAIAKLENGITVELVGVSYHPSEDREFWRPDGSPLPDRPYTKLNAWVRKGQPDEVDCREFAIRVDGLPKESLVGARFNPIVSAAGGGETKDGTFSGYWAAGPFKKNQASMSVGLILEPFGLPLEIGVDGKVTSVPPLRADLKPLYEQIDPLRVEADDGVTTLVVKPFPDISSRGQWRLLAIDVDGNSTRATTQREDSREMSCEFKIPLDRVAKFQFQLRPYRYWVTFDGISLEPGHVTDVDVAVETIAGEKIDAHDELTPAIVAANVRETMHWFENVKYTGTLHEVRNANAFIQDEPRPVETRARLQFQSDGRRWLGAEQAIVSDGNRLVEYGPTAFAGFDGDKFFFKDDRGVTLGENNQMDRRRSPRELFWHGARSADWLIAALDSFTARIVRRETTNDHECIVIQSEPGTPKPGENPNDWEKHVWHYEIVISPEQSWLPIKTTINYDGKLYATEEIKALRQTKDGVWYPKLVEFRSFEQPATVMSSSLGVGEPELNHQFVESDFKQSDTLMLASDAIDYRRGQTWHNDVWWPDLKDAWFGKFDWPQYDLRALAGLQSFSNAKLEGVAAPEIQVAEWLNGRFYRWDEPGPKLVVVFFFGGDAVSPTPQWLAGLKALWQRYFSCGVQVVGVVPSTADRNIVMRTVRSLDIKFPIAIDTKVDPGREFGKTFDAYGLQSYTGAFVVDDQRKVRMVVEKPGLKISPLEDVIREQLKVIDPKALERRDRLEIAAKVSFDITGDKLPNSEIETILADTRSDWSKHFANRLLEQADQTQKDWLQQHRLSVANVVDEATAVPDRLSTAEFRRITDEWKNQRAAKVGTGTLELKISAVTGRRDQFQQPHSARKSIVGVTAHIKAIPILRLLSSSIPGDWMLATDDEATIETDTQSDGRARFSGLRKGTYVVTITSPGWATVEQLVTLPKDDSKAGLGVTLNQGDTISGIVVDSVGNPVLGASVRIAARHFDPLAPARTTTEHLPREANTTDASGHFKFERLFSGAYTLEASAEGFAPTKLEQVSAGMDRCEIKLTKQN